ncbi:MAG: hypothetical protein ABI473_09945 [Candidatus Dormibacter sp.]
MIPAEVAEVIEGLIVASRYGTFDEDEGDVELVDRARAILARYRRAA